MNDIHLEGEIKAFYGDLKATEDILSYERENLARRLKNGLGEEMKTYINNPPKTNYLIELKFKIKRWWNKIKGSRF